MELESVSEMMLVCCLTTLYSHIDSKHVEKVFVYMEQMTDGWRAFRSG
jgi:hypothetical protein